MINITMAITIPNPCKLHIKVTRWTSLHTPISDSFFTSNIGYHKTTNTDHTEPKQPNHWYTISKHFHTHENQSRSINSSTPWIIQSRSCERTTAPIEDSTIHHTARNLLCLVIVHTSKFIHFYWIHYCISLATMQRFKPIDQSIFPKKTHFLPCAFHNIRQSIAITGFITKTLSRSPKSQRGKP